MKQSDELLNRMLRAAREPRTEAPVEASFGFATRVAARWAEQPRETIWLPLWEHLCGRVAVGMAVGAVVVSLAVWQSWLPVEHDETTALITQLNELVAVP